MATIRISVMEIYSVTFVYDIEVGEDEGLFLAFIRAREEHDRVSRQEVVDLLQYADTVMERVE